MAAFNASFYRARAEEMRRLAEKAHTESQRLSFLRLEASWQRLADQAEKPEMPEADEDSINQS